MSRRTKRQMALPPDQDGHTPIPTPAYRTRSAPASRLRPRLTMTF
jgi:hypothetical protein